MTIDGVQAKTLRVIPDERGRLMEILRSDDPIFRKFGQAYMTSVYPGAVKAWHYHKLQYDHLAVVKGMLKLVLYDARPDSATKGQLQEFFIGDHNPMLVQIPPMVYHGFKGIGPDETLVINCTTEPYNRTEPDEYRLDAHAKQIPYDWARKDR
jgi:dTDP-4-dehydrorhamnose 3,5-epimerase